MDCKFFLHEAPDPCHLIFCFLYRMLLKQKLFWGNLWRARTSSPQAKMIHLPPAAVTQWPSTNHIFPNPVRERQQSAPRSNSHLRCQRSVRRLAPQHRRRSQRRLATVDGLERCCPLRRAHQTPPSAELFSLHQVRVLWDRCQISYLDGRVIFRSLSWLGFCGLGTGRSLEFEVRRLRMRLDLWLLIPIHEACS